MVGIATDRERTIQAGSLVQIDARHYAGRQRSPIDKHGSTPST